MIIQKELVPAEACKEKPVMESKKYLFVKNHVREMAIHETSNCENNQEQNKDMTPCTQKGKKRKHLQERHSSDDGSAIKSNTNEISESDLQELKRVYKKCKSVLMKIESKYGHLLDLNEGDCVKQKKNNNSEPKQVCNCDLKSKVVFSEDGAVVEQAVKDSSDYHICPDRLRTYKRYQPKQVVLTENDSFAVPLPDNVQELEGMLKDPLTSILRQRVLDKIRFTRQTNLNMIRFDKKNIIAKLKENPDDIIDFKGTNFSSIVGYPSEPL